MFLFFHFQISNNCDSIHDDGNVWSIFATGWIKCDRNGMCAYFTRWGTVISIRSHIEFISSWRIVSEKKTHSFLHACYRQCLHVSISCQKWHHLLTDWMYWHTWKRKIKRERERNMVYACWYTYESFTLW